MQISRESQTRFRKPRTDRGLTGHIFAVEVEARKLKIFYKTCSEKKLTYIVYKVHRDFWPTNMAKRARGKNFRYGIFFLLLFFKPFFSILFKYLVYIQRFPWFFMYSNKWKGVEKKSSKSWTVTVFIFFSRLLCEA